MKRAMVIGSVVYDEIFTIEEVIKNEIPLKKGKIENLNLMFNAREKIKRYGGVGGNIAYGLAVQNQKPLLLSAAGQDFFYDYGPYLKKLNVDLRIMKGPKNSHTATFYSISDQNKEQIGIFQPNIYKKYVDKIELLDLVDKKELKAIKVVIFSPGTGPSTQKHFKQFAQFGNTKAIKILDPGQSLSTTFTREIFEKILPETDILIGNQIEINQMSCLYNLNLRDILNLGAKFIIETRGIKGSMIYTKEKAYPIPAYPAKKFKEATGAGDAFRAGLIKALLAGQDIKDSALLGAKVAAKSVEFIGAQGYKF
ncbi:MAG: hypothetical protein GF335_00990 [Candidatus Moranbacteria bacterium]|nr:hypothetical protein [Candidatus Moranbacteria bacterium]